MKKLIVIIFVFVLSTSFAQDMDPHKTDPDMKSVKTKALKMEFFAPLTGNFTLGYESYIKDGISWEAKFGIIGAGKNIENQKGAFARVGPKFKIRPDYITKGMVSAHPLRGAYIKPELVINHFRSDDSYGYPGYETTKESHTGGAILINYGKQFVLGNKITLDWSIGLGYGFGNDGDGGFRYGFASGGSDLPIAGSAGFTLGILL
ncbi:DUF3575 domain-containing protein [Fulvivirgaceae bacterium BMA12]|uniref:DUF3575 domain-containing protein n=1 Tax=Agaribacillus aureus TaxID=3051825 RepID=A0ABT8L497_9BACT|nr:DUF3575 domain-containing protein [Fulvivirgaceae bacterium BMA12]